MCKDDLSFGKFLRKFERDESGAIAAFAVVAFLTMFVAVGMGMDFMRQEAHRAELQDALDRGVLAAAALSDDVNAEAIVRDYLKSTNFIDSNVDLNVDPNKTFSTADIHAQASYVLNTTFLKVIGINTLAVSANSAASQSVSNIEISLALDISGSMARERTSMNQTTLQKMQNYGFQSQLSWGNNANDVSRLDLLRVAASNFVDDVLTPSNARTTSISLIPFSGSVNPGQIAFDALNDGVRRHDYSSCIELTEDDFRSSNAPAANSRSHVEHFQWYRFEADHGHQAEWGWCPSDAQSIEYLSNNASKLKQRISQFIAHDGTGTHIAMKWALSLLDENSRHLIGALDDHSTISSDFADRPASFNDNNVLKVIVIMTDGNTTDQVRVKDDFYPEPNQSNDRRRSNRNSSNAAAWVDYWANSSLGQNDRYRIGSNASRLESTRETNRSRLLAQCDLAKENEVIVFTIGFDLDPSSTAYEDLSACASSRNHFHSADGTELSEAFSAIAATITKLRLTQ